MTSRPALVLLTLTLPLFVSCSSKGSSSGSASAALNGTWDITASGRSPIGPSEMTVNGDTVDGFIADEDEGEAVSSEYDCTVSEDRLTFHVAAEGDVVSGTFTDTLKFAGPDCPEPLLEGEKSVSTITGKRTKAAPPSDTDLNGEWDVQPDGANAFVVLIDGLTAQGIDRVAKAEGKAPSVNVTIAGGVVSVASSNSKFVFAARKR